MFNATWAKGLDILSFSNQIVIIIFDGYVVRLALYWEKGILLEVNVHELQPVGEAPVE